MRPPQWLRRVWWEYPTRRDTRYILGAVAFAVWMLAIVMALVVGLRLVVR
jgi:hypothetical protein